MGKTVFKPGDRCGGCEIVRLIGAGGFAEVYEVIDEKGARRALKTLATEAEARPKIRERLAQEGTALLLIDHPNVVRLFASEFHDERVVLLLELVEGRTLREATEAFGGRVPPRTLAAWMLAACEGVAAAHEMGIVHRDLKPENILLTNDDNVAKVIDFGIAKLGNLGVKTTNEQRMGTAMYMAPEHMQQKQADPRMDVYSIGLVLYEALTGAHPIVNGPATVAEICARQLNHRPRPLVISAPWVPAALAALVDRAIEKEPERRQPSARALADALREALSRMPPDPASERATPVSSPSQSARLQGLAVTAKLSPDAIRSPAYGASTGSISAPALHAMPTAEIPGTGPIETTAPDAGSDRVGTIPPSGDTAPATLQSGSLPAVPAPRAPSSIAPPFAARSPRIARTQIAVAAIAAALGIGGGALTAAELTAPLRVHPKKGAPAKAAPASKPSAPRR